MSRATETNPTRRAVLGNVAAAVVITPAIPFTALALAEPVDPIFALIEAHRAADADYNAAIEDADFAEPGARRAEIHRQIAATVPTTAEGAVALLSYSAEYVGSGLEPEILDWPSADVFRNTAAALAA